MSAGTSIAGIRGMRSLVLLCSLALLVGCGSSQSEDDAITDDSNEINEGRGSIERDIDPPIAAPTNPAINAKLTDVLAQVKGTLVAGASEKLGEDCTIIRWKNATTKKVGLEQIDCKHSALLRVLADDGTTKAEHTDLNKDGKVDRWVGTSGAIVQLTDTNFDGKIDVVTERVDLLKDFSLAGYDEAFPKSRFLFRVREDRNRDGKLDFEKLLAKGALPSAAK